MAGAICLPRPSVVHFGGFELHRTHKQTVRMVNNSRRTQRMTIHNPTTPFFKATQSKVGAVAPGMWEEVVLEFCPTEHRYYYDCLRVVCAGCDPTIVPIHAYPVVNTVEFPTAIDFGKCSITESMSKIVPLKCQVPIEFEFELKIAKPNTFFEVYPLQGVVPANGQVDITFNFHPLRLCSAFMDVEVNISQFGFEPFTCSLSGAGQPDSSSCEPRDLELPATIHLKTKTSRPKVKTLKRPQLPPGHPQVEMGGILMPPTLNTVHHVAGVLTSQPGKLKIKDLKAKLEAGGDDEMSGRQMQEVSYTKKLADMTDKEKNREIRPATADCKVVTWGATTQSEEELETIQDARDAALDAAINKQRAEGRARTKTEATQGRPTHNAKAFPTFHKPSWTLDGQPESDPAPSTQEVRRELVELASSAIMKARLGGRITAIRNQLASFATKEEVAMAIKQSGGSQDSEGSGNAQGGGKPAQPCLPQFPEEELAAPDPVLTKDILSFDDTHTMPLEVPKHFELMGYSIMPIPALPAYVTVKTSKLLLTGAEEEDLLRGNRPVAVLPACSKDNLAPPGAKFAHEPTVVPPIPPEPQHSVPQHCKEPLSMNPVEMIKPQLRARGSNQLLRYPEVACDRLLGPIAPSDDEMGVTSLEEAVGSNTALSLWNLQTMRAVLPATRHQRHRQWFDTSVPVLLTGMPEDVTVEGSSCEEVYGEPVEVEEVSVPNPYHEAVVQLAQNTKQRRENWSARLHDGISKVNDMIVNPSLKLSYG